MSRIGPTFALESGAVFVQDLLVYQTPLEYVRSMCERYSSPGLRRNELSRDAKREHLAAAYKLRGDVAEKVLDQIYGPAP